jgi:predicted DNA-binding transcriptional regulator AlpA
VHEQHNTTASADDLLRMIRALPHEQIAAVLVALAARALEMPSPDSLTALPVPEPPRQEGDRLLTAEQVALVLGLDVTSVARRRFPFAKKLGRRTIRYSEAGLRSWMRNGRA